MRKMSDSDIIKQAYEELEGTAETSVLDKSAFDVSINPASLVGAITGAAIAKHKTTKDILQHQMENENSSVIAGNYYSQVQNIMNNLKVIFTPLGVMFVVKNGVKEITIENIATEEMTPDMYTAWQHKDYEYFKRLLINKMHSEIQFVEQEFAKKLIEKQLGMNQVLTKKAAEDVDVDVSDFGIYEIMDYVARVKDLYSGANNATEKMASTLYDLVNDDITYKISWGFDRPLEKYAFLGGKLDFLGFHNNNSKDIRALQGDYLNPHYLNNRVKIGFLPDRVVFSVDNKVITSLLAMDMNAETFDKFNEQDTKYFVKLFKIQTENGIARMKGKVPPPKSVTGQEKTAAANGDVKEIFTRNDIHPEVYRVALTKKYDDRWYNFEAMSLVKIIEDDFGLENGIADIPLNKILSIFAVNKSAIPFRSAHGFEKIIRSFNDLPVDFLASENTLTPEQLVFGLDITDVVTPDQDTYEYIGAAVFNYFIDILLKNGWLVLRPTITSTSQFKEDFYEQLNKYLLDNADRKELDAIDDEKITAAIMHSNDNIATITNSLLQTMRKKKINVTPGEFIDAMLSKAKDAANANLIRTQITNNVNLDAFLKAKRQLLAEQLKFFNLA